MALSRKASSRSATSSKKMFGLLPPSSSVAGIRLVAAACAMTRPVAVVPVKAILAMRLLLRQRHAGFAAVAVDDVQHARRQQVGDQLGQHEDADRRALGRLEHHAVAGAQRRGQLPGRHQDREVPRDDLADHAERLVEVVGDGVVVDLAQARLPAPARSRRSSGSGRSSAGCRRSASRGSACRCPPSRRRPAARGSARCRSAIFSSTSARSPAEVRPQASAAAWAASSASSMSSAVERAAFV